MAAAARNLGLIMRKLCRIGSPRGLQGREGLGCIVPFAWFPIFRSWDRWYRPRPSPRADTQALATAA